MTEKFEAIYQGPGGVGGLKMTERLIPAMGVLAELAQIDAKVKSPSSLDVPAATASSFAPVWPRAHRAP